MGYLTIYIALIFVGGNRFMPTIKASSSSEVICNMGASRVWAVYVPAKECRGTDDLDFINCLVDPDSLVVKSGSCKAKEYFQIGSENQEAK